jgi:hypothetical protein
VIRLFTRSATDCDGGVQIMRIPGIRSPPRGAQRAREWMCPTSNFRSVSRNFCVVNSCRITSLTENANLDVCCETSRAKSLTRLGINHAGVSCALFGISQIDCRLIDAGGAGRKPQVHFRGEANMNAGNSWLKRSKMTHSDISPPVPRPCACPRRCARARRDRLGYHLPLRRGTEVA